MKNEVRKLMSARIGERRASSGGPSRYDDRQSDFIHERNEDDLSERAAMPRRLMTNLILRRLGCFQGFGYRVGRAACASKVCSHIVVAGGTYRSRRKEPAREGRLTFVERLRTPGAVETRKAHEATKL
jgi:hypothetical protein